MHSPVSAATDRWLERRIVARARRRSPVLRLVPARCIRVAVTPAVVRLRRALALGAVVLPASSGVVLALTGLVH